MLSSVRVLPRCTVARAALRPARTLASATIRSAITSLRCSDARNASLVETRSVFRSENGRISMTIRTMCSAATANGENCSSDELRQLFAGKRVDTKRVAEAVRGRLDSDNVVTLLELSGKHNVHPKYFVTDTLLRQLALENESREYSTTELLSMMRALQPLKFARPRDTMELICTIVLHHLNRKKTMSPWDWSNVLYSMQHIDCSASYARPLTQHLLHVLERMPSDARLNAVCYAKAIYGLQQTSADDVLIRRLLRQIQRRTGGGAMKLDQKAASMVLFGLQRMCNAEPEVREVLEVVHKSVVRIRSMPVDGLTMAFAGLQKMVSGEPQFEKLSTTLTGHLIALREPMHVNDVCSILYSMHGMKPQHRSTEMLLGAVASKMQNAVGSVGLMQCARAVYGLQFADFTSRPARLILDRLGKELQQRQFRLTSSEQWLINQLLAYVGFGLQHMHLDLPEVQTILEEVKAIVPWEHVVVSPKAASTILYGLRYQPLVEVSELMDRIAPCMAREPSVWRPNQLGCGFYALRRFPASHSTVAAVRAVLRDKLLAASVVKFNDMTLANILASYRLCRALSDVDKDVLQFVLQQLQTQITELSPFSLIASLYGLAGLRSNEPVVLELQQLLTDRMRGAAWQLREVRHIVSLAEFAGTETAAGRELVLALAEILKSQQPPLKARDVKRCLSLIKPGAAAVGAAYVADMFDVMLAALESNQLSVSTSDQLAAWCSALFSLADHDPRIAKFLKFFARGHGPFLEVVRPEDLPNIMLGLSRITADQPDGEAMLLRLADTIDSSEAELLAHHISSICYNLQHVRLTSAAAQSLMSALASKIRSSNAVLDVNNMARCMFGLQHLNSGLLVSEELTQAVSSRAESSDPEFWRQVVEVVQGGVEEEQGGAVAVAEFEEDNDDLEEYLLQNEHGFNKNS